MICDCGDKAFTFTKIYSHEGKKYISLVGRCNKSLEETNKKKKRCSFKAEEILKETDLICQESESVPMIVDSKKEETREDYIKQLHNAITIIKKCQDTHHPFDKYTNRILYLSKKLNIPPYIQDKVTIEEYYNIADYYLKNPRPVPVSKPFEKYSIIDEFLKSVSKVKEPHDYKWKNGKRPLNFNEPTSQELYDHFKKLLTIERKVVKVKPVTRSKNKIISHVTGEFKTGAVDTENLVQEDELDIEEFESEEEDDYNDEDYKSD